MYFSTFIYIGIRNGVVTQSNVLKSNAIPTLYLPKSDLKTPSIIVNFFKQQNVSVYLIIVLFREKNYQYHHAV